MPGYAGGNECNGRTSGGRACSVGRVNCNAAAGGLFYWFAVVIVVLLMRYCCWVCLVTHTSDSDQIVRPDMGLGGGDRDIIFWKAEVHVDSACKVP